MPQLSIVIPIYNTPCDVLLRCFDSLGSLQGMVYEVLLIDDGSEASVGQFCKAYVKDHPDFRYFYQCNGGVSSARNHGIREAKGKYLMFVDADDQLMGQAISPALLEQSQSLIIFDILVCQGGQERCHHGFEEADLPVDRETVLHRLITSKALNSPCDKLFLREILCQEQLRFPEDFVTGEDWMFVAAFAQKAKTVCYVPQPCYRYLMDQGTGRSRVLRYPDKIVENQLDRFARKNEILVREVWSRYDPIQMKSRASVELIENLFNTAADLLMGKAFAGERRKKLIGAAVEAGEYLQPGAPKKTRLKLLVLKRFVFALRPLAALRGLYLRRQR